MKTSLLIKTVMVGLCASLMVFSFAGCTKEEMSSTESKIESTVSNVGSDMNSIMGNGSDTSSK